MGFESKNDEEEYGEEKKENNETEKDDDVEEKTVNDEWDDIDWSEVNSGEQEESIWNDIDWNDDGSGGQESSIWDDIDWNESEIGEENVKTDPNDINEEITPEQLDPNEGGENESDRYGDDENSPDGEENPEGSYENINSQSTTSVLVSESEEEIQESDQEELEKEIEKQLEEGVEAINKYLEEEAEFINAYQEILGAYEAEQLYKNMKEEEANKNEENSEKNEELENEKEAEQGEEVSEPQLNEEISEQENIEEELEEGLEEVEQNQVEPLIEEALETEPEPIVNEEEIERLQDVGLEEQFQTVHLKEYIEELIEKQNKENEQEKEEEVDVQEAISKEGNPELEKELEERLVEQHQVEPFIEEALEFEPEPIINEEEIEKLQEMDLEEQYETVRFNEYAEELEESQEKEKNKENDKIEQEKENLEQAQEEKNQSTYLQEKLDEQEWNLELNSEEKDEIEQHQVEAAIEEELEIEPEPIIEEEKLEHIKNLEPEKQIEAELFYELIKELSEKQNEEKEEHEEEKDQVELTKEEKIAQIMSELEISQEITSANEVELEQETNSPEEQREIEETKDHQEELEEILEQNKIIEQEVLLEIEQEEEHSEKTAQEKYENAKKLYTQQTGKRPIYANKETKGFKHWLEQQKKSVEKEKDEQKNKQKKEETWKWSLKNWIVRATEIDPKLKSELLRLVEEYDELEKLVEKYTQLYNKAHREKLSQIEKVEFKSLIKALQKIDPIKIELFLGIREIKRYLNERYYNYDFWDKPYINRIRRQFFTLLSQRYESIKEAQKKKYIEEILKNWMEEASDEKFSPKLKAALKEILKAYRELEELAVKFMELYNKEQNNKISQEEKLELKALIKILEKLGLYKIELFVTLRAIKKFGKEQNFDDSNREHFKLILNHIFSSRAYSSRRTSQHRLFYKRKYLIDKKGNEIPFLDIGKEVSKLTPLEFKRTYKGVYSQYFKYIRNNHNLHLGIKTVGKLLKGLKYMNTYGIVYKISLVRDVSGNKLKSGPIIFYTKSKEAEEGLIRVGRTINLRSRVAIYRYESNVNRRNLHFQNAFLKYGPRAFKIELLSVCKSVNEYKASEYFWTLYYNKKANQVGYDLSINKYFNPMLGSRGDMLKKYEVPKWKLTGNILGGFERAELDIMWENVPLGTLKGRIKEYFNTSDLYKIRLKLATPYINRCLRCGFTKEEALNYLLQNGFYMFSEKEYNARIRAFGSGIKRSSPDQLFKRMIKNLQNNYYHIPPRKVTGRTTSYYEQLRFNLFIIPYGKYLKSIGVKDKLEKGPINYDPKTNRFRSLNLDDIKGSIKKFSIIEHLVKLNASNIQVAYTLNLCKIDDDVRVRENARNKIDIYFERYKRRIAKISGDQVSNVTTQNVRNFIKSSKSGLPEYKNYIKKEGL